MPIGLVKWSTAVSEPVWSDKSHASDNSNPYRWLNARAFALHDGYVFEEIFQPPIGWLRLLTLFVQRCCNPMPTQLPML